MTGEAISWAKEVAAPVKRVTGKEQFVCSSFGGMLAEIAWIGQYDSVGQRNADQNTERRGLSNCAQESSRFVYAG
jgi:hypothetical protein